MPTQMKATTMASKASTVDARGRPGLLEGGNDTEKNTTANDTADMHHAASRSVAVQPQHNIQQDRHALAEHQWRQQPPGLEQLFAEFVMEISEKRVLSFVRRALNLLKVGNEFDLDKVDKALRSGMFPSLVLAANYLLIGENKKSLYMIFHSALINELSMRGPNPVEAILVNSSTLEQVGACCIHMRMACAQSHFEMIDFLRQSSGLLPPEERREFENILHLLPWTSLLQKGKEGQSDLLRHSLLRLVGPRKAQMIVTVPVLMNTDNTDTECNLRRVFYKDTTLGWWLKMNTIHLPSSNNYVRVVHKGRPLFLSSSKKKTLHSVGITHGDRLAIEASCRSNSNDSYASPREASKSKKASKKRNKKSTAKNKKPKCPQTYVLNDKQLAKQHKQEHSRSMNAVLEALGPILKERRDRLNDLTIKKTAPKTKRHNPKRSNVLEAGSQFVLVDQRCAKKAGKVAYPILVGEVSNLYKTSKFFPGCLITIDLHGCSKHEALEKLDTSLPLWVDAAMRGSDPWVIGVDIICGGGSQTLSGAVKGWIHTNRQVANRPKGLA